MTESNHVKDKFTIMTVHDVAEYLRLSEAKVYRLANEGLLPVIRIGKTWRFRKDLLDDWLAEQSRQEVNAPGQSLDEVQAHPDRRQKPDDKQQEQPDGME